MMATAMDTSVTRTQRGSSWARTAGGEIGSDMVTRAPSLESDMMTRAPSFDQVDAEESQEGHAEEHDRNRGRLPVGELLQPRDHQHRRDLGLEGHVARDEHHRAVLAEGAREGEGEAGDH